MAEEKKSLYDRVVKRLRQGKRVLLKKSDGSYSVALRMNGEKIVRTEFSVYSANEALDMANREIGIRLSTRKYLDGKGMDDHGIIILETLEDNYKKSPAYPPVPSYDVDEEDREDEDCDGDCDEDEDEDDYDYPTFNYPQIETNVKRSFIKKVILK